MTAPRPTRVFTPHLVRQDFLSAGEHCGLLDWSLANEGRFEPATLANGMVAPEIRRSLSLRDLGPMQPVLEQRIAALVPAVIGELRVTPFETSQIELELVAHNDGAHFVLHSDLYIGKRSQRGDRMLSGVYYFHRAPKAFSGGCLRLHAIGAKQGDAGIDVPPEQNSLVVFPSWGPHEVLPIACPSRAFADSRFAVNCWVYRANGLVAAEGIP